MRNHKIPLNKVQEAFNAAIKRRDGRCMIQDYEPCCGQLECSHFYTVGACPSLRFYPLNAWTQCSRHHLNHHTAVGSRHYAMFMATEHLEEMKSMQPMKHKFIKYTDELKAEIIRLCNADKLDELKELIEGELK